MVNRFGASVLAAALLALTAVVPARAQSTSATAAVHGLYDWYFAANKKRQAGWMNDLAHARPYLDPGLLALLQHGIAYDVKNHSADILDFDPFIAAQVPASSYNVGAPSGGGDRVVVPVSLSYGRSGKGAVRVIVRREGTSYRVYDIQTNDYALRALLTRNLKHAP